MSFHKTAGLLCLAVLPAVGLDLKTATIVPAANLSAPEKKAVTMLVEEIEKRTRLRLPVSDRKPASGPAIVVRRESGPAEGYKLRVSNGEVVVSGNDSR